MIEKCKNCIYFKRLEKDNDASWGVCEWIYSNDIKAPFWTIRKTKYSGSISPERTGCTVFKGK